MVLIHIDGVGGGVHIHRWTPLLTAASLVYGRSAASRAAVPRVVAMLGVLLFGVGVVLCASASVCC